MAQKLLKRKPRKVAPKKAQVEETGRAGAPRTPSAVLVGTYKEGQLSWIKRHGIYNYPVKDGDEFDEKSFASIKELWLYADVKGTRHVFEAEFVCIKTRDELVNEYGYPANGVFNAETQRRRGGRAVAPRPPHGSRYYVFKAKYLDYGPRLDDPVVIARTADFGRRSAKVKKAIEQFKADGEFAPLEHYLPSDLAKVPRNRLRVCEVAVQYYFWDMPEHKDLKPVVPFPPPTHPKFTFIDLFAGIGGFHLAMHSLGGRCVFASEWDKNAQETYAANYGIEPFGDIKKIDEKDIPPHDVLCAGFPCQPFSKAGKQEGFDDETKGTLFFDIERILKYHHTKFIILENVRNLVAHDNGNTWKTIHNHLVNLGYRLSPEPLIVSPHYFGVPQLRERVVVLGVYDPKHADKPLEINLPKPKKKSQCSLDTILEKDNHERDYKLTEEEIDAIDTWDEFYHGIKEKVIGFPIWLDWFKTPPPSDPEEMPDWKRDFVIKNNQLYKNNKEFIDAWLKRHNGLRHFTPTMRKMEWQCGDSVPSAWDAFMQMRPSGLRIKRPDCAPALVAIVQVPIIGKYRRRMTVREAARLQSFDDSFIPNGNKHEAYKQFGNAVNVQVIKHCAQSLFKEAGATF